MLTKMSPRLAQIVYQVGIIATSVLAIAGISNAIDGNTANALANTITAVLGLLGVGATTTAGIRVSRQRKDGTLDFTGPAAQQAVDAIAVVNAQAVTATADRERVLGALGDIAAATVPVVVGSLAQQVIRAASREA